VPSYILLSLPAGIGSTLMQDIVYSSLTPSGIDIGTAIADVGFTVASTYP